MLNLSSQGTNIRPEAKSSSSMASHEDTSTSSTYWRHFELRRCCLTEPGELVDLVHGYQVCLTLTGPVSTNWRVDGRNLPHRLSPDELCTATHGSTRVLSWDRPFEFLHLSVSPKFMLDLSEQHGFGKPVEILSCRGLRDDRLRNMLHMLQAEMSSDIRCGSLFGEQLCCALGVYLFEQYCSISSKETSARARLPGRALKGVLAYIDERIAEPVTIEDIANHARISRFYFTRLFRNTVGQTPGQYILDRRMERAKSLLKIGSVALKDVARLSGFQSRSHFASAFRQRTGVTPIHYRAIVG